MKTYASFEIDQALHSGEHVHDEYVPAHVAKGLYASTEIALKAIQKLAEEHGSIPDYLDDITSQLEMSLAAADGEE